MATESELRQELIRLYQQMSELTFPECRFVCRVPLSCCSPEYCHMAMAHAQDVWGVTMEPTGHASLPLMGEAGCVADPHFRPICTVHTCEMNGLGFKKGDLTWTENYFTLRDRIDECELELGAIRKEQKLCPSKT